MRPDISLISCFSPCRKPDGKQKPPETQINEYRQLFHHHCHRKQFIIFLVIQLLCQKTLPVIVSRTMMLGIQNPGWRILHCFFIMPRKYQLRFLTAKCSVFVNESHIHSLPKLSQNLFYTAFTSKLQVNNQFSVNFRTL